MEYLGHIISMDGIVVDPKKIQVIVEWPIPITISDVCSFLKFLSQQGAQIFENRSSFDKIDKVQKASMVFWS